MNEPEPTHSPETGHPGATHPTQSGLWLEAARVRTLPAAICPVAIGVAIAAQQGAAHLPAALAAVTAALAIQIGTNFANDYFDYHKGADHTPRQGRRRLLPSGLIAPAVMGRAAVWCFGLAVVIGLYLVLRGGLPVLAIGIASILAGVLYTGGPAPYGYRGLGDVFVLMFFGPVAVAGTHYVQALAFDWGAVLAGLAPGLLATAILAVNNLRDATTDAGSGKRTLAVIMGGRFVRGEYAACMLGGIVVVPTVLVLAGFTGPWVLIALLAMVPALPLLREMRTETDPDRLNHMLARTGQVLVVFSALFCLGWLM